MRRRGRRSGLLVLQDRQKSETETRERRIRESISRYRRGMGGNRVRLTEFICIRTSSLNQRHVSKLVKTNTFIWVNSIGTVCYYLRRKLLEQTVYSEVLFDIVRPMNRPTHSLVRVFNPSPHRNPEKGVVGSYKSKKLNV